MPRWKVCITEEAAAVLHSVLSDVDKAVIQEWAGHIRDHGPGYLLERPGTWADHPLYGEWRGHRASSFSHSGRIVYRVHEDVVTVAVVRITAHHDYRRTR